MPPKFQFYFLLLYFTIPRGLGDNQELSPSHQVLKENLNSAKIPPCQLCRILTNSFLKQMERTSRGKFEGGDAAWEEERLKSYSTSEVRLIEIQENLCADIKDGINQCHFLAEENEQLLEEWWFNKQMEEPDLFKFLCINTLKHCCPENHYGMECKACPGFPDNVCNKNGKCKEVALRVSHSSLMSSDRMKPGDWAVTINFL
uniref:Uncharacterized protein n=1 Tax=Timema poppense TaxID=170557 RepID=A0A7R9GX69_TIMPO|nr:unnamed protein product [Timema poppensis]